jgi:hypothetical protein
MAAEGGTCQAGAVLRSMREPETGKPGPAARLVAVLLVTALVGMSGPVLMPAIRWVVALL